MNITRRDFINYTLLPGFRPRMIELFASGFHYISFFVAIVFNTVRLLPANHPYLQARNMGKYGVLQVIAEAANNIVFSKNNIDQIILFVCVLIGLVLIILQFGLMAMALFIGPAVAQLMPPGTVFFVTTPEQQNTDLAGMMMDMVFGVPGIFNSCVSQGGGCTDSEGEAIQASVNNVNWMLEPGSSFPMPFHSALHQIFEFFNIGLLVVAFMITMYFVATIILETAESGTPFGKRFEKVWAPLRLVMAFGLLMPIPSGYGLNSAQYIVLYAAKYGSGFATNGWILFNEELNTQNQLGTEELKVAQPNPPEVGALLQFLFVAKTCAEYENSIEPPPGEQRKEVQPYFVDEPFAVNAQGAPNLLIGPDEQYEEVVAFAKGKNRLIIRFGYPDQEKNASARGWVEPTCGEMVFPLSDPRPVGNEPDNVEKGVEAMQRYYLFVIQELWYEIFEGNPNSFIVDIYPEAGNNKYPYNYVVHHSSKNLGNRDASPLPENEYKAALQSFYANDLYNAMNNPGESDLDGIINTSEGAIKEMSNSGRWDIDQALKDKGWAGAGIWYNRIAEMNGSMSTAVLGIPMPMRYPDAMEYVAYKKRTAEKGGGSHSSGFNVEIINNSDLGKTTIDPNKAKVYAEAYNFWAKDSGVSTPHSSPTGNVAIDVVNTLFGTSGLFDMRRNVNVHPLAQLSGIGKALVEGAIKNLTYAALGNAAGSVLGFVGSKVGEDVMKSLSSFVVTFAMIGLTAGFVLFYVVPFLPFIYFFFAFGGWIKGIFEAMIGAPLWALAHIRIDGKGLAGQAAVSGYFLIFEIFLRPILMIFGLLASISIFAALVSVLNQIFDLVVANVGGFDIETESKSPADQGMIASMRAGLDEFFFTVFYALIVYMLGMASFKLIDQIPNNILRFMGQQVKTFNDGQENPAEGLVSTVSIGAQQTLSKVGSGLQGFLK
jgi:conjugal transfer/type IV secretion protein DotA/TraY